MAQQQNPVNEPTQKGVGSHSSFRPNYSMYQTMRFGELTPSFAMEVVPKDNITLRATKDVDTYTLKAPLMTAVRHLSTFQYVPMRALLPNTAELIITNPLVGDDVVAEDCNCGIRYSVLRSVLRSLVTSVSSLSAGVFGSTNLNIFLHDFQLLMNLCSNGSVLANLGINLHDSLSIIRAHSSIDIDRLFEECINDFWDAVVEYYGSEEVGYPVTLRTLSASGYTDTVYVLSSTRSRFFGDRVLDKRMFCEMLRDGYYFIASETMEGTFPAFSISLRGSATDSDFDDFLNLSRVAAYQICCADFFSNDKVDAVFSAQLYRQNMQSLIGSPLPTFKYNGIDIYYDALSAYNITSMLTSAIQNVSAWYYISNLLCFQRSLRFGDYFAGAKVSPLAVGDVNIGVDSQSMSVDVIDVTRNIQRQRFLNQVNRVGRKFKDYIKGIFGDVPMPDAHEPQWIGDFSNIIGAEESVNTTFAGNSQPINMRSNLRSNTNKYAFNVQVSEPGVLIGIDYFDVPRAYDCGIDRTCLAADRYDMFNPFMQFVGDQDVKGIEIDTAQHTPFGYQLRYAEYKERVDRCAGGFIDFLPGYAIMLDHKDLSGAFDPSIPLEISSDFIRAHAYEFDKLYVSLTNYSLAGYFHFIVRSDFSVDAKRPMSFAPSIL